MTEALLAIAVVLGLIAAGGIVGLWLQRRPVLHIQIGKWRCEACGITVRGSVQVGHPVNHACGRQMVRTSGPDDD